jgi:predicted  nucleic acid-binding Zn-ribbon protein
MRSQLEEQTVQASLFRAELNKMAQEKTALGNRLAERTEQLKEAKGQVELWKAKVEKIKERYAEL